MTFHKLLNLPTSGYYIEKALFDHEQIEEIKSLIDSEEYCVRDILHHKPELIDLIVPKIKSKSLGNYNVVRSVLFQKQPTNNWHVPWHQDKLIQVKHRFEAEGYGPWSTKENVLHVQPPFEIMEQVISARIHFSKCTRDTGPLRLIAGSHQAGYQTLEEGSPVNYDEIICDEGDVLFFSPLLLHASAKSASSSCRTILHLELAPNDLVCPGDWFVSY